MIEPIARGTALAPTVEEWRSVTGLEGRYEVSNHGRVRRINPTASRKTISAGGVLKPDIAPDGRPQFCMSSADGKRVRRRGCRLVAEAFIGPRPPGTVIAHLDGVADHNYPTNIVYTTQGDNLSHKEKHGTVTRGSANAAAKITEDDVIYILLNYTPYSPIDGAHALAKKYGIHYQQIWSILYGKVWSHVNPEIRRLVTGAQRGSCRAVVADHHR